MDYYSVLIDNLSVYFTSDVLTIIVALLALLITFIAVSIPTMILATADFQKSFFDMVINPECINAIKKEGLIHEIKELSKRNLRNSLFMNFVYRMTWWSSVLAIVLTLVISVVIPVLSLDKKYLISFLVIILIIYMLLMLFIFMIMPLIMLKRSSKGSYPKLAKIQDKIIDKIYKACPHDEISEGKEESKMGIIVEINLKSDKEPNNSMQQTDPIE